MSAVEYQCERSTHFDMMRDGGRDDDAGRCDKFALAAFGIVPGKADLPIQQRKHTPDILLELMFTQQARR